MPVRLGALAERIRTSLFLVPTLCVVAGAAAGLAMVTLDDRLGDAVVELPFVLTTTVNGAQEILSTVAQATIAFAGIAFSVSLLILQQASSQFSPRVIGALFRDPFNRRVMGVVIGTFTYCLMVLRSVRDLEGESTQAVIPNLSVGVAVLLGVVAILATVAFIDHSAHSMEISAILHRVTGQALEQLRRGSGDAVAEVALVPPPGGGHVVPFTRHGWVQQLDREALLALAPPGGTVVVATYPGRYAVVGTPLCRVWPPPPPEEADELAARADDAVGIGPTRTMQEDPGYGIRQLADVALKALSPGVNDPTTAQDAILHLTTVLRELLVRPPAPLVTADDQGRHLVLEQRPDHLELLDLAYSELRRAAAPMPAVATYLLDSLHLLVLAVEEHGVPDRVPLLVRHADLVVEAASAADLLPADLEALRTTWARRFGGGARAAG
jgi:uncharacterized membrane protein